MNIVNLYSLNIGEGTVLDHFVTRNNSKENRVSISFNFRR